ncbi:MAG: SPOR domain-containing protein [Pseudomonadota bacterium]
MQKTLFAAVACVFTNAALADHFNVQIGAYKSPATAAQTVPADAGEVRQIKGDDGLTRLVVGPFHTRADADQARDELRVNGFPGAFVRSGLSGGKAVQEVSATYSAPQSDIEADSDAEGELVYLDGKLHRKVGDTFIPVK